MDARGVLDDDHVLALHAAIAQLCYGGGCVGHQARLVGRILPGPRNHPRAVARPNLLRIGLDNGVKRGGIDQTLFDQQ